MNKCICDEFCNCCTERQKLLDNFFYRFQRTPNRPRDKVGDGSTCLKGSTDECRHAFQGIVCQPTQNISDGILESDGDFTKKAQRLIACGCRPGDHSTKSLANALGSSDNLLEHSDCFRQRPVQ